MERTKLAVREEGDEASSILLLQIKTQIELIPESQHGAREEVLQLASKLWINISVGLAYQSSVSEIGVENQLKYAIGVRFLGTIYCFRWNWDELRLLAQGSLAGHLLECGCQLTRGYYMHPGDKHRNMSFQIDEFIYHECLIHPALLCHPK
ncbi:hypothetical protein PHJA_000886200 [Phtheirospermum japonicum]|uniref:Acyclic terpene utilisation N-terminal domain-containing protein n=1 Tax=Phtheirospermum japonicum TaxID=374723 RepID=A0A830BV09_9LAMI|nr:hypothetical protein PHJA_000886200 [Phtheirospermum japonicum]